MVTSKAKGEKTEAIVLAELIKRDYIVLQPFGDNQRYDFVIDTKDGFKRLQCKTGRFRNGSVQFNLASVATNTKGSKLKNYKGQVDYFVVYCYENSKTYLVPEAIVGVSLCCLRVESLPKNISVDRVNLASDYELK